MKSLLLIVAIFIGMHESSYCRNHDLSAELSDVKNIQYGITAIDAEIKYSGTPVAMVKWDDNLGNNLLFIAETGDNFNGDVKSKELFVYHFITGRSGNEQLWKIYDYIGDCPVDLTLEFVNESLAITDLDSDGVGESSFAYKMSCKGDVSADDMKLIMHEGEKKYALRGSMNLIINGLELEKGSMIVDPSFKNAPPEFLQFAKAHWSKFKTEKSGE